MEYLESIMETFVLDIFDGNALAPITNKYCGFSAALTGGVMNEKCNLH